MGAGISGCLAALSLRRVLDDVEMMDRRTAARIDFPMTVGPGLVQELHELGLSGKWNVWGGKTPVTAQLSAWGAPEMECELGVIPNPPRYLVRRMALEMFLREAACQCGIKVCQSFEPRSQECVVVDATGRSGQIARTGGARRYAASTLVAMHGVGLHTSLPDACTAVQSGPDGWWFAVGERNRASVMYLSTRVAFAGCSDPDQPGEFAALVGTICFYRPASLAAMSWLDTASADNWFAVGDSALALDPVLGSGVEVAAQSARLLREAVRVRDPHDFYNSSMNRLVAKYRIARHRLYGRAAAYHGGEFWAQQLRM